MRAHCAHSARIPLYKSMCAGSHWFTHALVWSTGTVLMMGFPEHTLHIGTLVAKFKTILPCAASRQRKTGYRSVQTLVLSKLHSPHPILCTEPLFLGTSVPSVGVGEKKLKSAQGSHKG